MKIHGSCLCGEVRFEIDQVVGPFEICHCNRCRKRSGGQGMSTVGVMSVDYRMTSGKALVATHAAPVLYAQPAYHSLFCSNCGSPVPEPDPTEDKLEIPAGLLDNDPGIKPDKHIFVELLPAWDAITDELPQYDIRRLVKARQGRVLADDFELRKHVVVVSSSL